MSQREVGLLLHSISWAVQEDEIELAPQIKLGRTPGSIVGQLYGDLCRDAGLDEGEPFDFESHILLGATYPGAEYSDGHSYFSPLVRLANVIALVLQEPIGMSRLIESADGFSTCTLTEFLHSHGIMTKFLSGSNPAPVLDAEAIVDIDRAWRVSEAYWITNPMMSRLVRALARFEIGWRVATIEDLWLNLGISLALILPGMRPEERCEKLASVFGNDLITASVEQFFEIHRGLVGGCVIAPDQSLSPLLAVYGLTAMLLRAVLLDEKQAKDADEGMLRLEHIFSPEAI